MDFAEDIRLGVLGSNTESYGINHWVGEKKNSILVTIQEALSAAMEPTVNFSADAIAKYLGLYFSKECICLLVCSKNGFSIFNFY